MAEPTRVDLSRVAQDFQLRRTQVEALVSLLDEGNTIPFITRYRKERTGGLDEETIRLVEKRVAALRVLADRKTTVLKSIEAQGKLTDDLRSAIEACESLKQLEDLYLPFKPKKQTLATAARAKGLGPLADALWQDAESARDLNAAASALVDPEKQLGSVDEVLAGVGHIIAETISETATARAALRRIIWQSGKIVSERVKDLPEDKGKAHRDYFQFSEPLEKIPPHRVLALNRGEKEEVLRVRIEANEDAARSAVVAVLPAEPHTHIERLRTIANDALTRLLLPSLEREVRRQLTDESEEHAVRVFARNLRSLLFQRPVAGKRLLAIDPGFRTGCKLAVLDETGKLIATGLVNPHPPIAERAQAKEQIVAIVREHRIDVVVIGNGTACRETEELVAEIVAESLPELSYTIVNEAGASVYSTSSIGREEFPDQDATVRGTVSIGRRLQDPLSELVKIDAQHMGVGLYQHDIHPRHLKSSLGAIIESCVNFVGVDLNTASVPLLRHVSGLNQLTARGLVEWRQKNGAFRSRDQIREVQGIGDAVFTQSVGFLKISGGTNPLDATWVHPESYLVAERLLARVELTPDVLRNGDGATLLSEKLKILPLEQLADELQVGAMTLHDIVESMSRPGRDPREDVDAPIFRRGVLKLEDLTPGMELRGTVLNVVDFGAFVDIGLKEGGLVHISQLSTRFIRSPHDVVSVGQIVTVWVMSVDKDRSRVSLTMIAPGTPRRAPKGRDPARPASRASQSVTATARAAAVEPAPAVEPSVDRPPIRSRPPARPAPKPRPVHVHKPKPKPPPPPLPQSVLNGDEPARSFGELKRLWDAKNKH